MGNYLSFSILMIRCDSFIGPRTLRASPKQTKLKNYSARAPNTASFTLNVYEAHTLHPEVPDEHHNMQMWLYTL